MLSRFSPRRIRICLTNYGIGFVLHFHIGRLSPSVGTGRRCAAILGSFRFFAVAIPKLALFWKNGSQPGAKAKPQAVLHFGFVLSYLMSSGDV
jgi:hypothetical protein